MFLLFTENNAFKDVDDERKQLALAALKSTFGVSGVNGLLNINSSWIKVVDFLKWFSEYKTRKL